MRIENFQGFVSQPVVAVEEEDVVAPGVVEAGVARGAEAAVGLGDDVDAAVARSVVGQYGGAAVGRAVVDADGLPVAAGLRQHAVEALAQVGLHVVDGYDDGEKHGGLIGLDDIDPVQLQRVIVVPHGTAIGGDGGVNTHLATDVDGVAVVCTMGVGEMANGALQQRFQLLLRGRYLQPLGIGGKSVEMWMAHGVRADGAQGVGSQGFQLVGADTQSLSGVPPHGHLIVDEPCGDIDSKWHSKTLQQRVGESVVVAVAVVEGEAYPLLFTSTEDWRIGIFFHASFSLQKVING